VDLSFDLTLNGSLTGEAPLSRLSGPGWIRGRNVQVQPGAFGGDLLTMIEKKETWTADVPKVSMRMEGGKIHHSGFPIKLSDHELSTSGWIGLDGSYRLDLNVPITERMVEQYPNLKPLKGDHLTVPVTKTDGKTRVGIEEALRKSIQKALKKKAEDRLREGLDRLLK